MNQSNAQQPQGGTKLVIVALGLALAAVVAVNLYVERVKSQVRAQSFTVYRLNRSVRPGERFKPDYVDAVSMPLSFENSFQGYVRDEGMSAHAGDEVHRFAEQGEFLRNDVFTIATGEDDYRRPRIGARFVKLTVNPRNIPGNLQPEMVVDILAPFAGSAGVPNVLPVMEAVKVIAVGTRTADYDSQNPRARPSSSFHTITIEVTPEEAAQLSIIEKLAVGDFELHLRNPADESHPNIPGGGINPRVLEMIENMKRTPAPAEPTR